MGMAQAQRQSFEDRLARISQGAPNTMGDVHVGPVDEEAARGNRRRSANVVRVKPKKAKEAKTTSGAASILLIPVAALIGAISMIAGQAAAFHFFQDGGEFPLTLPEAASVIEPYLIYANFAIAAVLALIFSWAFGFSGFLGKLAVIGGAAAFFYYQPEIIERFPDVFTAFFSEGYVAAHTRGV